MESLKQQNVFFLLEVAALCNVWVTPWDILSFSLRLTNHLCLNCPFLCHQFILLWIKYKQRAKNGNFLIVKSNNITLQPSHQWNIVQIWSDEVLGAATPARYKDISDHRPYIRGAVAHIYIYIYQAQYSKSEQEIFYPWSHRYCSTVLNTVILLCLCHCSSFNLLPLCAAQLWVINH